jgi:hypothetical protein
VLLQIDQLPCHVLVVTATNHCELLDRAVWRHNVAKASLSPSNSRCPTATRPPLQAVQAILLERLHSRVAGIEVDLNAALSFDTTIIQGTRNICWLRPKLMASACSEHQHQTTFQSLPPQAKSKWPYAF